MGAERADTKEMAIFAGTKRASDRPAAQTAAAADGNVLIEQTRQNVARRLVDRDFHASLLLGVAFLVTALMLAFTVDSARSSDPLTILLLVAGYALASRVDFEIGTGYACPTQLVLVPMLFVLPAGIVPIAVAAGIVLGSLTQYARGSLHLERVFMRLGNCWHAVGPALVLGLAGEPVPNLGDWPLYLAALAAQFALDYATTALRGWTALGVAPRMHFRTMLDVYMIDGGLATIGLAVAFAAVQSPFGVLLALPLIGLLSVFARERRVRLDHELELRDAYRGTAFLLGDVVEADDGYTGEHSRDVVELTLSVVDELGLDEQASRDAEFAALLHDVGKIRVPNEIINKAGPLTDEEWEIVKQHTVEGERLLHRVGGLLGEIGRIIRSCHERFDGGGYPDGLAGEDIPLIARIVYCCDAYNAMTSDRSYRAALPCLEAVAELRRGAGTQFDPAVVKALVAVVERG